MKRNYIGKTVTIIGLTALLALPVCAGNIDIWKVIRVIDTATRILEEGQYLTSSDGSRIVDEQRYRDKDAMIRTVLDLFTPGWRENSEDAKDLAVRELVRRLGPRQTVVTIRDR